MATTLRTSISPVEDNMTIVDDWVDWLPSCMGDDISSFFEDLYHDIHLDADKTPGYHVTSQGNLAYDCSDSLENSGLSIMDQDLSLGIGGLSGKNPVMLFQPVTIATIDANQLDTFTNRETPVASTRTMNGTLPNVLDCQTFPNQQSGMYDDMTMMENFELFADPSAAGVHPGITTRNAIFAQTHAQGIGACDRSVLSVMGPTAMTSRALPFLPAKKMSKYTYKPRNATTAVKPLRTAYATKRLASKDTEVVSDEAETNRSGLGWVRYDQTSFNKSDVAPRPVHVCDLPEITRKRGRREPLTELKRKKTAEMRKLKSCLMCRMKKKDVL
ncbi:MAG: hypothetical protein M1830_004398 [Pleopsidium flavum]|nr:MAG: hypothetical protein M1830_004398 [Pleopsidium flavum]